MASTKKYSISTSYPDMTVNHSLLESLAGAKLTDAQAKNLAAYIENEIDNALPDFIADCIHMGVEVFCDMGDDA